MFSTNKSIHSSDIEFRKRINPDDISTKIFYDTSPQDHNPDEKTFSITPTPVVIDCSPSDEIFKRIVKLSNQCNEVIKRRFREINACRSLFDKETEKENLNLIESFFKDEDVKKFIKFITSQNYDENDATYREVFLRRYNSFQTCKAQQDLKIDEIDSNSFFKIDELVSNQLITYRQAIDLIEDIDTIAKQFSVKPKDNKSIKVGQFSVKPKDNEPIQISQIPGTVIFMLEPEVSWNKRPELNRHFSQTPGSVIFMPEHVALRSVRPEMNIHLRRSTLTRIRVNQR